MSAKLVELIETEELRGDGKPGDVYRRVRQWWTKEGELVAEKDDWKTERDAVRLGECARLEAILDEQLGKEAEPVGLRTRVLAAAVGCKKWLEHDAEDRRRRLQEAIQQETANDPTRCAKPGCYNPCQLYSPGNYSKLCRAHNAANAKRQREARERSGRRPKK